ncbi:hypothetical protein Glove_100g12 [Diversispora epigaea]|uniref:RRM domain-containing protein n=1 Tax=Diversispora epigaea TaxID=1348612 RepID=A0A397J4M2_9GLOM|nr:hypothetical protein Glove_100g12 [Diversispora epigaea]
MSSSSKKKGTKMSLTDFLADQSTGSWADEMDDLPSAPAASYTGYGDHNDSHRRGGSFGDRSRGFPSGRTNSRDTRYESHESTRDARFGSRSERAPQPLPTAPPYTAHLGNLPFDLTELEVENFFRGSKISTIRILRDRDEKPKGFGYVEFEDLESLTSALDMSGEPLGNRPIRVSVADPPRDRDQREDRTAGEWRRAAPKESPISPRGDRFGNREDRWSERGGFRDRSDRPDRGDRINEKVDRIDRGDRDRGDRSIDRTERTKTDTEWRGGAFSSNKTNSFRERRSEERIGNNNNSMRKPEIKAENSVHIDTRSVASDGGTSPPPMRKRLELKPRGSTTTTSPNEPTALPRSNKPNPFGEAKPIDSDEALRRVEERRKQKEKEKEEKEKANITDADEKIVESKENGDSDK